MTEKDRARKKNWMKGECRMEAKEIEYARDVLKAIKNNITVRSIVYIGDDDAEKTMLIDAVENIADELNVICENMDAKADFIVQFTLILKSIACKISAVENDNIINAIKYLSVSLEDNATSGEELYMVNDLSKALTDVFIALGKTAKASKTPIVIIITEIQYLTKEQITALITALHRANQLDYPITLLGTGLPQIRRLLGNAKSYSERLFEFRHIRG